MESSLVQNIYASEQKELTWKLNRNCPFSSTSYSALRTVSLLAGGRTGLSSATVMGMAVSHRWAAVTRCLLFSHDLMQLNKKIVQPQPALVCGTEGANVGTVSPTQPPSKGQHTHVDSLFTEM